MWESYEVECECASLASILSKRRLFVARNCSNNVSDLVFIQDPRTQRYFALIRTPIPFSFRRAWSASGVCG